MISKKKYFEELGNLEFMKLLNKNVGMCSLEEINRIRNFLMKGMEVNKKFVNDAKDGSK